MQRHTTNGRRAASQPGRQPGRAASTKSAQQPAQASELATRLASIEHVLHAQQQRIAEQEQELHALRAALAASAADTADAAPSAPVTAEGVVPAPRLKPPSAGLQTGLQTSRRALLMAGGTVAAVAAFEVATSHAPTAQAHGADASHASHASHASKSSKAALGGVAWATGTVNADEETLVKPSGAGYGSNDVLQVQIGTGTVYSPAPLKAAITAYDTTTNNIGLYASSSTGYGLYGVTNSGNGATGAGLSGTANTGVGVAGMSAAGIAVSGNSTTGLGASFSGGQAPIALGLSGSAGAPTGNHVGGEIFGDVNGDLWVCTASGSPGTWVKLAHLTPGATTGGGAITYLSKPIRLFDSRPGQPANSHPGKPLQPNTSTTVQVAGVFYNTITVPTAISGAIGNVTVLDASGGAFVEIVPSGAGFTGASTTNIGGPGQIVANGFSVGLSSGGALDIYVAGVAVDVIIDLFAVVS